jgi:membrane protease YdiL (CAAX protease family)
MDIKTSPLVAMGREAKHPTPWWLAWPVGIAIIFGGLISGDLLGQAILGHPDVTSPIHQFIDITGFGMIVVLLALWLRLKEGRAFSSVGLRGVNPVGKLVGGLAIGAAMMTLGVVVPWAMGQYELGVSAHARLGMDALLWLIPLFVVFILQGSTEELVLRGYMLQTGGLQMPGLAAIVGTSLLFSAMHRDFDPIPFVNIVLYAVFACFVALADGNLWRICGIHAGWNFFQGNVFGLPVSGNTEGTSLWNFGPAQGSNVAITGGNFGVEASLMGTAVLTVALMVAVWHYRTRAAQRN